MLGDEVALDTSVAIAILNGRGEASRWVLGFREIWLPVPTLGELHFGALNSARPEENLSRIHAFSSQCKVLPAQRKTAEVYSTLRLELKRKGKPIPENDLWIAAACVEHGLPLATADGHFRELSQLTVVVVNSSR